MARPRGFIPNYTPRSSAGLLELALEGNEPRMPGADDDEDKLPFEP